MKYKIDKDTLESLISEVIYPTELKVEKDLQLEYNQSVTFLKDFNFFKLALAPFADELDKDYLKDKLSMLIRENETKYGKEYIISLIEYFCDLYKDWFLRNRGVECKNFYLYRDIINNVKATIEKEEVVDEDSDDGFIEFDDFDNEDLFETDDNGSREMHYDDEEKISAVEYMEENPLDSDLIADIKDLLDVYWDVSAKHDYLTEEFIEQYLDILRRFGTVFEFTSEFRNLAKSIYILIEILEGLDLENIKNGETLKALLDAVMEDLEKWFKSVIVNQSANDIHYLDASLLSSVEQIKIISLDVD